MTLGIPTHEWGSADSDAPGILLLQEIFGVSGYIKQRAADLHALGYYLKPKVPSLHHFGNDDTFHDAAASAPAWRRTEDFLAHHLPTTQG